jgi:maleylpyruvate isomerase
MSSNPPVLHGYFRSGTSYRVRIALNLKGVEYDPAPVDLVAGAQGSADYSALNPQKLVPALVSDGATLTQSPAILEWIEETWPEPPLLPGDALTRARTRAFAAAVGCDIHPLQNLRVLNKVKSDYGQDQDGALDWARHWITTGFEALERLMEAQAERNAAPGPFFLGDTISMAEVYLVPQMFNARRFEVALSRFPRLTGADAAAQAVPAFAAAHPSRQPDAR